MSKPEPKKFAVYNSRNVFIRYIFMHCNYPETVKDILIKVNNMAESIIVKPV